jgi:hypothetical protein
MDHHRRPGTIDYSKWDHVMDSDDDNENDTSSGVQVTRLDEPSRVTIPGRHSTSSESTVDSTVRSDHTSSSSSKVTSIPTNTVFPPPTWTMKGGYVDLTALESSPLPSPLPLSSLSNVCNRNLLHWDDHLPHVMRPQWVYWMQDRTTVELRIGPLPTTRMPPSTSDSTSSVDDNSHKLRWNCYVTGQVSYHDRHCAVSVFDHSHAGTIMTNHDSNNNNNNNNNDCIEPQQNEGAEPRNIGKVQGGTAPPQLTITMAYNDVAQNPNSSHSETIVTWFTDSMMYPIHRSEEDDIAIGNDDVDPTNVDWSIESIVKPSDMTQSPIPTLHEGTIRFIRITLHKATPVPSMTWWWKRPITSCPEINPHESSASSNTSSSMVTVWEEAHRMFRDNMRKKKTQCEDMS